jgi:sulfate transport system substrate-binding protein
VLDGLQAYLSFLYSPWAQNLIGQNHYRPRNPQAAAKYAVNFPKIPLVTIDGQFGGWRKAQAAFFADGAAFGRIYKPG